MCGIGAVIGEKDAGKTLQSMLQRLDYRGYDSWGIATNKQTVKDVGEVPTGDLGIKGEFGIAHTRWATHGDVTTANAHPHESCEGNTTCTYGDLCDPSEDVNKPRFAIAHNGIVENYQEIKEDLEREIDNGIVHEYTSETDSEVIAHYIETVVEYDNLSVRQALDGFEFKAEGNYAVAVVDRKEEAIYAIRNGSPLVIGKSEEENFVGSDLYSFSPYTSEAYFMEDGDIAKVTNDQIIVNGEEIDTEQFEWTQEEKDLEDYDHWMRKEIDEIPGAIRDYLDSMVGDQAQRLNKIADKLQNSEKVIFTASGTSYHASLLGVYYLQKAGIEAQTLIASEFENYERVDENTALVALSQSGETRDVLNAMNHARERGADIVSLVNVPHSTIQRESDLTLEIRAGQEICVAATKTFINQLVTLMSIAQRMGYDIDLSSISKDLESSIPELEQRAIEYSESYLKNSRKHDLEDVYIIGEGETYPVAREIALKLKEIPYIHAEGMMAGELKHGTLALIEDGTNVIALNSEENDLSSTVSELESRNANLFNLHDSTDTPMEMKASIYGFLASYHIAKEKDLPIDKPRNLAKSVTVE